MKILKYILMTLFVMGMFTGCPLDDDNNSNTEFSNNVRAALSQSENDEPLEITDTVDESTSFDSLL
jgi:hypothetical protein